MTCRSCSYTLHMSGILGTGLRGKSPPLPNNVLICQLPLVFFPMPKRTQQNLKKSYKQYEVSFAVTIIIQGDQSLKREKSKSCSMSLECQ
jgi:hypothetical protein